ncbi:MAG: class I SAM-dependent methyltransferase [Terriglobales bacterium]
MTRIEAANETAEPSGTLFSRAAAMMQPWLTSFAALRANPYDWAREGLSRNRGRLMQRAYRLPAVQLSSIASVADCRSEAILDRILLPPFCAGRHDDFSALMSIVKAKRPRIVVELGTSYGNTVANICRVCPEARVYTVNALPEQITGTLITHALTREEIGSVYRRHGFSSQVEQIYCDTLNLDLSKYLSEPVADLAIVDACHDPRHVINDFHKVAPYMRAQGIVLLHDTHPSMRGHLWGSYMGCMKLRMHGYEIQHVTGTWWGVWRNPGAAQS